MQPIMVDHVETVHPGVRDVNHLDYVVQGVSTTSGKDYSVDVEDAAIGVYLFCSLHDFLPNERCEVSPEVDC